MAENTDNDVCIDANEFAGNLPRRLPLGRTEKFWLGIANEKSILETAHILQSLGDFGVEVERNVREAEVEERKRELKRRVSVKEYFSSSLKKVFETLDIVLDWLERSAKNAKDEMKKKSHDKTQPGLQSDKTDGETKDVDGKQPNTYTQKKEGVLRGLYHITELGSYTCFVGFLELVSKSLDLPENRYTAKREHIKECLKEVEENKQKLFKLVETACDIMQKIIKDDKLNHRKAYAFNSTVRQANVIVESCKDLLSDAEETIDELMKIMGTMKTFSRLLRFAGFGATCYVLYQISPSTSTVDSLATYTSHAGLTLIWELVGNFSLKHIAFAATCAVSGYAWLSLFPSRAYAFRDDLEDLKLKHKRLTHALHGLEKRLEAATEDVHKKSKQ